MQTYDTAPGKDASPFEPCGEIADDRLDHQSLWMFADPGLADAIREAWHLNDRREFRVVLIHLIRERAIAACVDLIKGVARDETADDYYRIVSLEACGDHEELTEISQRLVSDPSRASPRIAAGFAKVLFPESLSVDELLTLIDNSQAPTQYSIEGFQYCIGDLWTACPSTTQRNELAAGLAALCHSHGANCVVQLRAYVKPSSPASTLDHNSRRNFRNASCEGITRRAPRLVLNRQPTKSNPSHTRLTVVGFALKGPEATNNAAQRLTL